MENFETYIAKGKEISFIDVPENEILQILNINRKVFNVLKSYNKCSKNKIYDLTERIILLNAALTYVENEETLHETYLKEHITHKKNYLSYLKKNYDRGILTQDCQIYNQELIRPFFTECSAQEELLVLENQVKYNAKLNRQYGEYWLETIDPCHRPYMETYKKFWLENGVSPKEQPFFLWLEDKIQPNVPQIQYIPNQEKYFYEIHLHNGNFYQKGLLAHTHNLSCFVIDEQGRYYLGMPNKFLRHTSFSYGRPVIFAGEAQFNNGQIIQLANFSGHYCPTAKDTYRAIQKIKKDAYIFDNAQISIFDGTIQNYNIKEFEKNFEKRELNLGILKSFKQNYK